MTTRDEIVRGLHSQLDQWNNRITSLENELKSRQHQLSNAARSQVIDLRSRFSHIEEKARGHPI